ncbi:hypothetical protein ACFFX0_09230 [Citricoccus parietis]|uniref:Uncharacterized protein n=1 Tax=Citricoccus parietis TaxID=592307 RepID=A0ABV5FXG8_9MICC
MSKDGRFGRPSWCSDGAKVRESALASTSAVLEATMRGPLVRTTGARGLGSGSDSCVSPPFTSLRLRQRSAGCSGRTRTVPVRPRWMSGITTRSCASSLPWGWRTCP